MRERNGISMATRGMSANIGKFRLTITLLIIVAGSGCQRLSADMSSDIAPSLQPSLALAPTDSLQHSLFREEDRHAPYDDRLQAYLRIRAGLNDPDDRVAAEDSLFRRWEAHPDDFLCIDAAVTEHQFLRRQDAYERMVALAAGDDSTSAVARFVFARRKWGRRSDAIDAFWAASARADELDPLQRLWLTYRLALVESRAGRHADGIARLAAHLEEAWHEGGPVLAGLYWYDIARSSLWAGSLGDALVACADAAACARRAHAPYLEIQVRLLQGQICDARCEYDVARSIFTECETLAIAEGYPNWTRVAVGRLAILAHSRGDLSGELAMIHRTRELAVATRDTFGIIKSILGIGSVHRRAVAPDSVLYWMHRAEDLDATWTGGRAANAITEAWMWIDLQEGQFASADSLLSLVKARDSRQGDTRSVGSLLIDLVQQDLETGRVAQAIEHLAAAEARSDQLFLSSGNQDPAWELLLIGARVRARQGDLGAARDRLRRAAEHPFATQNLQTSWRFQQCRAEVAALAGDDATAVDAYQQCLELATRMRDDPLIDRSQVRLGEILIRDGRLAEARALFAANLDTPVFWPRIAARLFTGIAWAREADVGNASRCFEEVDAMLTHDAPRDLRSRLRLEQARIAASRDDPKLANQLLGDVVFVRGEAVDDVENEVVRAAQHGLAREVAEFTASLLWDFPQVRTRGDGGATAFVRVARILRGRTRELPVPAKRDDPLAVFLLGDQRAFVWVTNNGHWWWSELPDRQRIATLARDVITDMEYPDRVVDWVAARELASILLTQVWSHWPAGGTLEIVPDAELIDLPWAALPEPMQPEAAVPDGAPVLVIDHGPVVLGDLTLDRPVDLPAPTPAVRPLLVLANNDARHGNDGLRQAESEGKAVAALWPAGRVEMLMGERATWNEVRSLDIARFGTIHVASHATFLPGAPEYSALLLAGSPGGGLTPREIRSLPLDAALVYLSCCETARVANDRGLSTDSFVRSFLGAGAVAVVASSIKVDDDAARMLAERFYHHLLAGTTRAAALRTAQIEVRMASKSWQHPYYWAFTAVHTAF